MAYLKWGGKRFYPQKKQPYKPDINELMKPLSEKVGKGNVWGSQIMNVQKDGETPVPVSPTPTPSVTPTMTVTPTPTPTPSPLPSPSVELISSATSVSDSSTFTFSSQSIGDGGGAICVAIVSNGAAPSRGLTSASIGGVASNNYSKNASGLGGIHPVVGLSWLTVTGTSTADISFTFNGTMNGCKIYTYRLKNLNSDVPLALGEQVGSSVTSIQINNGSQPADSLGVIVGATYDLGAPIPTLSFTNATIDDTYNSGLGTIGAVGTFDETAGGTLTMDFNSNETANMVALNLVYN